MTSIVRVSGSFLVANHAQCIACWAISSFGGYA